MVRCARVIFIPQVALSSLPVSFKFTSSVVCVGCEDAVGLMRMDSVRHVLLESGFGRELSPRVLRAPVAHGEAEATFEEGLQVGVVGVATCIGAFTHEETVGLAH